MIIIDRDTQTQTGIVGRLSDGSDRQEIVITNFFVKVESNDRFYILSFDHEPTDGEILTAFNAGQGEEITSVEDLAGKLSEKEQRITDLELAIASILGGA